MRTIALEEHFTTPEIFGNSAAVGSIAQPHVWADASRRLLDLTAERLPAMDAAGLNVQVLSINSPGIQGEKDPATAVGRAAAINDLIASTVAEHPDRFAGFAALPLQDPHAAVKELERAVTQLGLTGAMVNGHTQGRYLDDPAFRDVWEQLVALDVPLYLHPATSVDTADVLTGNPVLNGPMWSWGNDTATQVLRLVFAGVFDEFPDAKLMVGHMGEGLPFVLWRLDSRWGFHNHHGIELKRGNPSEYLRHNLYVTTSGVCDPGPLQCTLTALGADHILFATDYPFEDLDAHTEFLRNAPISDADRHAIAHGNAERLLRV